MTNKIEFIFDINTANKDEKLRTLLGKLIAYDAKKDYLYMDLRNLVPLPDDLYDKKMAMKYWGTKIIPFEIKVEMNDDNNLSIEYDYPSFPTKALESIFSENKDIINSIKLIRNNKIIYKVSKNDNKFKKDKLNYFYITKNYDKNRVNRIGFDNEIIDDWIISSFYSFKKTYYANAFSDEQDVLISSINEYVNQFVNSIIEYNTFIQFRSNGFNNTLGLKEEELNNGNVSIIESAKLINNKNRRKILEKLFDPYCYLNLC